ncbi:MAG: oleate hydratase [Candidatus Staskawiczbacteria bacterium]|nr:oleate hydratase [Candidatus Staskawiczbacteria bacterium]
MKEKKDKNVYLIGAGIASLASAAYLIREGKIPGRNIIILEESNIIGGSMDGEKFSKNSYIMRGYRMFEKKVYTSTFDLMSFIPSLNKSGGTLRDEFLEFNKKNKVFDKCRLVENGAKVQSSYLGLSWKDKRDLMRIMNRSEVSLGSSQIKDNFGAQFFRTNYWYEMCTIFAFQPWHSAAEFRRYCLRYIQDTPKINTLRCIENTPYAQQDSLILPILKWLNGQGVHFEKNSRVYDLDFEQNKSVERICYFKGSKKNKIIVGENDYVLATVGSITENSSIGSMNKAPKQKIDKLSGAWELWKNIAKKQENFGRPSVFANNIDKSKLESFTITFQGSEVPDLIKKFTGSETGHGGAITFKDSNWLISMIIPHQPHFINQPKNLTVCWGYSLFPDKKGNYVKKSMLECTGREILIELFSHFGFEKNMEKIIKKSICIPCILPYASSQFLPRKKGDRPAVIPEGSKNFAFIGQFCEVPEEATFTVEYSVRSAQIAVYSLLNLHHKIPPIYQGKTHIKILYNVLKTVFR